MADLTLEKRIDLYRFLRLNRSLEERLVLLYRQGRIVGGLYRSLGQEATSVGSAFALEKGDVLGPLIRNLGSVLVMGYSAREVLTQHLSRAASPSGGKEGNLHFGRPDRGVVSSISMLGALVPVMAGIALAGRMQRRRTVAMTYIGDGGTSTGAFHEGVYRRVKEDLPEEDFVVPIGKAAVRREGRDLSVLTYGAMVWTALDAARTLEAEGIDAEVVDLRTLFPLDEETILESVGKTSRAIVLHEATRTGGIGGEVAAVLSERCFESLDAPVVRVTAPDTPVPFSPSLEEFFLPNAEKVCRAARALVGY